MAVTDYKYPGTAANVDRSSKVAWGNPSYAVSSNDQRAICDVAKNTYGDWLRLTNFGFAAGDIPEGAVINGIEVVIERQSEDSTDVKDSAIYLRSGSAVQVGDNKASATGWPTNTDTEATYGGASDMWGTSLARADFLDTDFGIDISAANVDASAAREARIDCVKIRVYYTPTYETDDERAAKTSGIMGTNSERSSKVYAGYANTVSDDLSTTDKKDVGNTTAKWDGDGEVTME